MYYYPYVSCVTGVFLAFILQFVLAFVSSITVDAAFNVLHAVCVSDLKYVLHSRFM